MAGNRGVKYNPDFNNVYKTELAKDMKATPKTGELDALAKTDGSTNVSHGNGTPETLNQLRGTSLEDAGK